MFFCTVLSLFVTTEDISHTFKFRFELFSTLTSKLIHRLLLLLYVIKALTYSFVIKLPKYNLNTFSVSLRELVLT